jgi:hypothetical protein
MKQKYEIEFNELIAGLKQEIADNEKNINEILDDGRYMEANNYSIYNSALEEAIIRIEIALNNLKGDA